jgi:hypothetical protein
MSVAGVWVISPLNTAPSDPTLSDPAPLKKYLPVEPYSGQGKEEDWKSFFAHQKAQDELKAARETPEAKAAWMAQIQNALHQC